MSDREANDDLDPNKRKRPAARAATAQEAVPATDEARPAVESGAPKRAESRAWSDKSERRVSVRAVGAKSTEARKTKTVAAARSSAKVAARATKPASSVEATAPAEGLSEPPPLDTDRDLVGLLRDVEGAQGDAPARRRAADAFGRIAARLAPESPAVSQADDRFLGATRELFSSSYYLKQWSQLGMRGRSEQVDDFGLDPTYEARVQPLLDVVYQRYFRVHMEGSEHLPSDGGAVLCCNHGGTLPWDGVMLKVALRHAHPSGPALRWLIDDFVFHAPFLGAWLNRIGAVRACPENAERLLERGELLAVFPEGVKGIGKPYRERYRLQRFGRGGHVKLALRMGVPLIPLAIVGAEETYPLLYKMRAFSKLLGVPFIPITPLFPWLGPLGLLPLPSRWQIVVGEPMQELEGLSARAADDSVLVNDLNERLRGKVQDLVQRALEMRGPAAFF